MIKREFYFVRHGQTDHNLSLAKTDHGDISLNSTGRQQALNIAPLVSRLSIQTICCSPLKRAKETKELFMPNKEHQEIDDLGECTAKIWNEMIALGPDAFTKGSSAVRNFLNQAKNGLNQVLEQKGPVLVVSHGGIHWAICYWMAVKEHNWLIDNCKLVHFSLSKTGQWRANAPFFT